MSALSTINALPDIAWDVYEGLSASPKSLPPRLFYDAQGSALFEAITRLPEYYLTRTEHAILSTHAGEMAEQAGANVSVIELGAGTATKTGLLLSALLRRQLRVHYYPIDISPAALHCAAERLSGEFPNLVVHPIAGDYTAGMAQLHNVRGRKLVLYLGSSIGNFEPLQARQLLRNLRVALAGGDALLLGTDLAKSPSILLPAYDDAQGITARFNKNLLVRINRELHGNFVLDRFRHVVRWNAARSRIEMHLESGCEQEAYLAALNLRVAFAAGERVHTENSYKYTVSTVTSMLQEAFAIERSWSDHRGWYSVQLARAT